MVCGVLGCGVWGGGAGQTKAGGRLGRMGWKKDVLVEIIHGFIHVLLLLYSEHLSPNEP